MREFNICIGTRVIARLRELDDVNEYTFYVNRFDLEETTLAKIKDYLEQFQREYGNQR